MPRTSAGILLYRVPVADAPEVLLAHPGGPFWRGRDRGAWSIPKGEAHEGEDLLAAARREFAEETGFPLSGVPRPLGRVRQSGGKLVYAWAVPGDADPGRLESNTFEMEWPRGSGQRQRFPEVDRVAWLDLASAREHILPAQAPFLDALAALLDGG